ncbi:MAG: beta-galactosidase, partial [Armatimonadota bacterium]
MFLANQLRAIFVIMTVAITSAAIQSADAAKVQGKVIGINQDLLWTEEKEIDPLISLMKEAGVTHIRIPIRWVSVEPAKGKWDFSKADMVVRKLRAARIEILGS